jgi:Carboxymuconolactone decarboxylase family
MKIMLILATGILLSAGPNVRAADSDNAPRPIPLTRPTMKELLEDMKQRKPRIPLPPLTEEEKAKGERGGGYEGRLRALYMPGGGNMSLDNKFKVQLFWIVSRSNNCQYCLGHQESKLLNAGMKEDEIAALDGDWSDFGPAERAAYAFARKFTYEPHKLCDADIDALRKHYKDLQILEMIMSMAGNNAINRWKEGTGSPQNATGGANIGRKSETPPKETPAKHTYVTPTSDTYKTKISKVAPIEIEPKPGEPMASTVCKRPALESREEVEKMLEAARKRTARLPLVDEEKARELLGADAPKGSLPEWVRLLANFAGQGKSRIVSQRQAEEKGDLTPVMKAQAAWIIARQDRAWYAAGRAKQQLKDLGQTDDQIYTLDGDWSNFTPAERSLFTVARKLAASPVVLTDADVADALKASGPKEVVQMISFVTTCASFDRITEAAGLRLDK